MSAPQSPGMFSIATTAAPTSSSVTIRCRAARETNSPFGVGGGGAGALGLASEVALHPRSADRAGRERVDDHPERADLMRQRRGQSDHRHLRRGVGGTPGQRPLAAHRRQVDHVPGSPRDHRRKEGPAHQEDTADVDGEHVVPVVDADVDQASATGPATPALLTRIDTSSSASRSASAATDAVVGDVDDLGPRRRSDLGRHRGQLLGVPADQDRSARRPPARAWAMARPRPFPAPVTSAVRPARCGPVERSGTSARWR